MEKTRSHLSTLKRTIQRKKLIDLCNNSLEKRAKDNPSSANIKGKLYIPFEIYG